MGLLSGLGKVIGTVGSVGSLVPGPWQPFAKGAAVLGGALSGAGKEKEASGLRKQALDLANQRYAAAAPFRDQLAQLAVAPKPQREDLSSLFADPGNVYARTIPRPSLAAQASAAEPPPVAPPTQPGVGAFTEAMRNRFGGIPSKLLQRGAVT